jgi:hypothetical protein
MQFVLSRWVIDEATGFVHTYTWELARSGASRQMIRQYGPRTLPNGTVFPTVHVKAELNGDRILVIWIERINEINFSYRPGGLDFGVSAPAGTQIIDYHEDRKHPKRGTCYYPVADVLVYAQSL